MRRKMISPWMVLTLLLAPLSVLAADTLDDLVAAAIGGDEAAVEAAVARAYSDAEFPFAKAGARVAELCAQHAAPDQEPKAVEGQMRALRSLLAVVVERSGDREIRLVVPKLIDALNRGGAECNLLVEAAISNLCIHAFSEADYTASATSAADWADHQKMWTQWWASNGTKPYMALILGGFARAGVQIDFGDKSDAAFDGVVQALIHALLHEGTHIRANAARLLRAGCFRRVNTPWAYDAEAPLASRRDAVAEAQRLYTENKTVVLENLRGKP